MKITLIVEGSTEKAFLPHLRNYLRPRLVNGGMPILDPYPYNGSIPKGDKLKREVAHLLSDRRSPSDHVIALTDVYTGANPPDFSDAADAKTKMRQWVGNEPRFHPHAAQFEFEAWLLPYLPQIPKSHNPEQVNHNNPPSHRIKDVLRRGQGRYNYVKWRDAKQILEGKDLNVAIQQCPELKSFVNTILSICGGQTIP